MDSIPVFAAREEAKAFDRDDALGFTRNEFVIPMKAEITNARLAERGLSQYFKTSHAGESGLTDDPGLR
jgi:hypothetical protein